VLRKLISGGLTSAERAALDTAVKLEIPHGGWTSTANGNELAPKYELKSVEAEDVILSVRKNVEESDGVLLVLRGDASGKLAQLEKLAGDGQKPFFYIDLGRVSKFEAALNICKWIAEENIETLYVAGDTEETSDISRDVTDILESVIYLGYAERRDPVRMDLRRTTPKHPETLEEALEILLSDLPLKDRVIIANMTLGELGSLYNTVGRHISDFFGLWTGNEPLVESCRRKTGQKTLRVENIPDVILRSLWERLKTTHRLRVVKE